MLLALPVDADGELLAGIDENLRAGEIERVPSVLKDHHRGPGRGGSRPEHAGAIPALSKAEPTTGRYFVAWTSQKSSPSRAGVLHIKHTLISRLCPRFRSALLSKYFARARFSASSAACRFC